jgi:hypothetical protein
MAWSYSGDPSVSTLDWVRYKIGDTDSNDQLLTDGEVAFQITECGRFEAAARCCEAIAGKYARDADFGNMSLNVSRSQRVEQYERLATTLRKQGIGRLTPSNPSASIDWKRDRDSESDNVVQPMFRRGQDDNPQSVGNLSGTSGIDPEDV